jgi:hypothetical protein
MRTRCFVLAAVTAPPAPADRNTRGVGSVKRISLVASSSLLVEVTVPPVPVVLNIKAMDSVCRNNSHKPTQSRGRMGLSSSPCLGLLLVL